MTQLHDDENQEYYTLWHSTKGYKKERDSLQETKRERERERETFTDMLVPVVVTFFDSLCNIIINIPRFSLSLSLFPLKLHLESQGIGRKVEDGMQYKYIGAHEWECFCQTVINEWDECRKPFFSPFSFFLGSLMVFSWKFDSEEDREREGVLVIEGERKRWN